MAKLHLPGDWAPTLVFALAGLPLYLIPAEPGAEAIPGKAALGLIFFGLSLLLGIAAHRGRSISEGARYYFWKSLDTSFGPVVFSALLLFFGSNFLLIDGAALFSESYAKSQQMSFNFWLLFLGLGFLTFVYYFCLHVRITVFNKDKSFLTMIGKPWSFTRHYKARDFDGLLLTTDLSYAGQLGMIQSWRRHYFIFATNGKKKVLILRDGSLEEAKKSIEELTRLTGLKQLQEDPEGMPLVPDLRVEMGGRKVSLQEIMDSHQADSVGSLSDLKKKHPEARVVKEKPKDFPSNSKKKTCFNGDHFIALLEAAKVPCFLDHSTPDQTDIWFFKAPILVPLKFMENFSDYQDFAKALPDKFIHFKGMNFDQDWEEFRWEPDAKYPPADANEEVKLFWGRQGKGEPNP